MKKTGRIRQKGRARQIDRQIRLASPADLPQVAELFLFSFLETVTHLYGAAPPRKEKLCGALQDFFSFLLKEEPKAFWVVQKEEGAAQGLAGYLIVSSDLLLLWRRAIWGGYIFRWAAKFLAGAYGLNLKAVGRALSNKMTFWRTSRFQPYRAQILSLAVAEHCRGQGIGRALLQKGLAYLHKQSRYRIKLEVRPWNKAALHLYQSFGFYQVGTTRDSQGEWLVMVAGAANTGPGMGTKPSREQEAGAANISRQTIKGRR